MLLGAYVVQTRGALSWEPFVASIPIALLVALILYVNEIPDRRGDARAGKRTLPVRFSRKASSPATTSRPPRPTSRSSSASSRAPAGPDAADAADDPARAPGIARPRPELRQPVRADGGHGRQRPAPPVGGAARCSWATSSCSSSASWRRRAPLPAPLSRRRRRLAADPLQLLVAAEQDQLVARRRARRRGAG